MGDSRNKSGAGGGAVEVQIAQESAAAVRSRIDSGVRARAAEPPPLALRRTASLAPELHSLAESVEELRARMAAYGDVTTMRAGWAGRVELALKGALRKLVKRHLDQEKDVHAALQTVLTQLSAVLAAEHDLIDEHATTLAEESLRRDRRDKDV